VQRRPPAWIVLVLLVLTLLPLRQARPGKWWAECKDKWAERKQDRERESREYVEEPNLTLAGTLIESGDYSGAQAALQQVDPTRKDIDLGLYHTLQGLIHLAGGEWEKSRDSFIQAMEAGGDTELTHLYLAQAYYGLGDYEATVTELEAAGETGDAKPEAHLLRVSCYQKLEQQPEAYGALLRAERRFPGDRRFTEQKLLLLIEMGLCAQALTEGGEYLSDPAATADDYISLGDALRRGRHFRASLELLEKARLLDPENTKVLIALAHTYLDAGQPRTAAGLMEEASRYDGKHLAEAAELFRRAKDYDRALYLNAGILDQAVKIKQRMGILLDLERFEEAAAMEARLSRLGLLEDPKVRYGLAYAYYRTGRYPRAESHLKKVADPELARASAELMKAIEACRRDGRQCVY
jgi:tetratricopeptide (TPR) repeat protein